MLWGYCCHPWRELTSPNTVPAWGVSHCCVVGLAVLLPVPVAKRGSQLSAGWWGAGQAQLRRDAWGWALLTRWSQRNPAAWLAFIRTASLHPYWHMLIHRVAVTCQTSTDSLEGLLSWLSQPYPLLTSHTGQMCRAAFLSGPALLGPSSGTGAGQRVESFTIFESAAFTLQANYWLNHIWQTPE